MGQRRLCTRVSGVDGLHLPCLNVRAQRRLDLLAVLDRLGRARSSGIEGREVEHLRGALTEGVLRLRPNRLRLAPRDVRAVGCLELVEDHRPERTVRVTWLESLPNDALIVGIDSGEVRAHGEGSAPD